jgi:hypothetical protein
MKVADLQQYFTDLAKLLHATDGKKSSAELSKIAEGLQPFRDYDLTNFANFLTRAEDYSRTGLVPVIPPKPGSRSKPPAKPSVDLGALQAEVAHLHGTASSPDVTFESIEALRPKLDQLKKPGVLSVVESIGLVGMKSKSKADIINAIVARIKSIKQSSIRTSIIDRPGVLS